MFYSTLTFMDRFILIYKFVSKKILTTIGDFFTQPPVAASHWSGIRDATKPGPACAQVALHTIIRGEDMEITGSEDCLYLNVFSPMTKVSISLLNFPYDKCVYFPFLFHL